MGQYADWELAFDVKSKVEITSPGNEGRNLENKQCLISNPPLQHGLLLSRFLMNFRKARGLHQHEAILISKCSGVYTFASFGEKPGGSGFFPFFYFATEQMATEFASFLRTPSLTYICTHLSRPDRIRYTMGHTQGFHRQQ